METGNKTFHVRCTVKRGIFHNPESGYSVFAAIPEDGGKEFIVTGNSFAVSEGVLLDVQGSEYNTVIIPILNSAYIMLQRNLVYTAITRAKDRCIVIGDKQALYAAVSNLYLKNRRLFVNRQTFLCQRIQGLAKNITL